MQHSKAQQLPGGLGHSIGLDNMVMAPTTILSHLRLTASCCCFGQQQAEQYLMYYPVVSGYTCPVWTAVAGYHLQHQ